MNRCREVIVDIEATCSADGSVPWRETETIEIGAVNRRDILQADCERHGLIYRYEHEDLAAAWRARYGGRRQGHRRAMKRAGLKPSGQAHRGLDDAKDIARLADWLDRPFLENPTA